MIHEYCPRCGEKIGYLEPSKPGKVYRTPESQRKWALGYYWRNRAEILAKRKGDRAKNKELLEENEVFGRTYRGSALLGARTWAEGFARRDAVKRALSAQKIL